MRLLVILILLFSLNSFAQDEIEVNQEIKEIYLVDIVNGKPVNVRKDSADEQPKNEVRSLENQREKFSKQIQNAQGEIIPQKDENNMNFPQSIPDFITWACGLLLVTVIGILTRTLKELSECLKEMRECYIKHETRSEDFRKYLEKQSDNIVLYWDKRIAEQDKIIDTRVKEYLKFAENVVEVQNKILLTQNNILNRIDVYK